MADQAQRDRQARYRAKNRQKLSAKEGVRQAELRAVARVERDRAASERYRAHEEALLDEWMALHPGQDPNSSWEFLSWCRERTRGKRRGGWLGAERSLI